MRGGPCYEKVVSSIWPLEQLFEPPARIEQRLREKEAAIRIENQGDDGDPPLFACRVCGLEACERHYCPACLADTMVPVRRARR